MSHRNTEVAEGDPIALLAGIPQRMAGPALSESEVLRLCTLLLCARKQAGLSAQQFVGMKRTSVMRFAKRFGLTRAEVRLGQRFVELLTTAHHVSRTSALIARTRGVGMRRKLQ